MTTTPAVVSDVGTTVRASAPDGSNDHLVLDLRPREQIAVVAFGQDPNTVFVMTRRDDRRYSVYSVPTTGGAPRLLVRDDPVRPMADACSLRPPRMRAMCT